MTDVFVSYSRKNTSFAERFSERLTVSNKSAWVDWAGIPLTSPNWWTEIQQGIEASDAFVFIMSPDSMASVVCNMELDYAIDLDKRIVPIVYEDVVAKDAFASIADFSPDAAMEERLEGEDILDIARQNWQRLSHINWVFFRETDDFDKAFDKLIKALETDLDYVKAHTRYLIRAKEWEAANKRVDLLLFGEEIAYGEKWLADADRYALQNKEHKTAPDSQTTPDSQPDDKVSNPSATPLQRKFITTSRAEENTRRRQVRTAQIGIGLLVTALMGGLIFAGLIVDRTRDEVDTVYAVSQLTLAVADGRVADANANLAEVLPTLTAFNDQAATAQSDLDLVRTEAASVTTKVANAYTVLTPIPVTLTQASVIINQIATGRDLALEISSILIDSGLSDEEVVQELGNIIVRYPGAELAYQARAQVLANQGRYEEAIADYSQTILLAEEIGNLDGLPIYYVQRAQVHTANNDVASAESDIATAIDLIEGYANQLLEFSNYNGAMSTLNTAITLFPENGTFYDLRARAMYLFNRLASSEDIFADWQRARELGMTLPDYALTFMEDFANSEVTLDNFLDTFFATDLGENTGELDQLVIDIWEINGQSGDVLSLQVNADFDTTLAVETYLTELIAYNDDAPDLPNNNSRIERIILPYNGVYYISVGSYLNRDGGTYTLVVDQIDSDVELEAMPLEIGDNLGSLAASTQVAWSYTPSVDQRVDIRITADFVANIAVIDANGDVIAYNDFDDNNVLAMALAPLTMLADDTYHILVSSRSGGGAYTLTVQESAG